MTHRLAFLITLTLAFGCGDDDGPADGGADATSDTIVADTAADGPSSDTGTDAPMADAGDDAGGDAGGDAGDDAGGDTAPPACGDAVDVDGPAALAALAPAAWGSAAFTSQRMSTADLDATATFTLTGTDFTLPTDCTAGSCSPDIMVNIRGTVPGVTNAGGDIAIESGASFRMRFDVPFFPPAGQFAVVTIEKACALDCTAEERRCDEDSACYTAGENFCRACDHESPMRCACVDADGDRPDDVDCFFVTGDIANAGTCMDGTCVSMF